jgi:hypothetical protein
MRSLDESHKEAILRILREARTCLAADDIAAKLNAEAQDSGWGRALVDAEASKLPEVYKFKDKWCLKSETTELISTCEKRDTWQATTRHSKGYLVAIMRGHDVAPFKGNFYLYDEHWKAEDYHPATGGMPAYSVDQIKAMFSSGDLCLLRGTIPE